MVLQNKSVSWTAATFQSYLCFNKIDPNAQNETHIPPAHTQIKILIYAKLLKTVDPKHFSRSPV